MSCSFKTILALAWPQVLMMFAQSMVALADIVVAGHINKEVQASLGLISISIFFFLVIATAMASGAVSIIAQSLGAGLKQRAQRYVGLIMLLAVGGSVVFTIAFTIFKSAFMVLLQVPESVLPVAEYFLDVYLYVLPAYYLLLISNAAFQAHKLVRFPLYSMCLITALNGVMDFGLGLGMWGFPHMGYKGVAWATFASVSAGAALNLYTMRRMGLLSLAALPSLRWMRRAWRHLFNYAWPAGMTQILWQGSYMVLYAVIGSLPAERIGPLAGFAAGMRIESILFMPAFALNLTASILVGQTLGARQYWQAKNVVLRILTLGCSLITLGAGLIWIFRDPIVSFIAPDPLVHANTLSYLSFCLLATPFTVGAMILTGALTGAGAMVYNMTTFCLAAWLVRLPLAYTMGHLIWKNADGIWLSLLVSQICHCLCLLFIWQFMDWHRFAMRSTPPSRSTTRS